MNYLLNFELGFYSGACEGCKYEGKKGINCKKEN